MFPKKYSNLSYDEVSNMFNYLSDLEYVDIKYFDENEVCFAILPKSRILEENMIDEKKLNQKFALVLLLSGIISSICSFCGALLSHIILG